MSPKIAVIVGPTGGIGSAVVEAVKASGSYDEVVGLGRQSNPPLDLVDEMTIKASADHLKSLEGEVRLVFDASGALALDGSRPEKSLREIDPAHLARSYAVNTIGPALLMKHFLPLFPREGRCVFATLSARVGSIGDNRLGGWYAYRAAKAGLNQIVRTAAIELSRRNPEAIAVALHPGTVRTSLTEKFTKTGLEVQEPGVAARRLLQVVEGLSSAETGCFFDHLGKPIAW
ncbi:SDR family NAD(P)-dependent oxidoreductase [Roseibium sp. MMSF_3412]|uniref:SDR family NAD(P)-dependent oxidoreductase n=1 Tax=Roseibium sp. MMSF_3412 TaxID=3046712 RepID=UPI00273E9AC8|nr:SDR family NAD(P)-dependent oxidoreductase [Roseibium sp. MMSF_3412]